MASSCKDKWFAFRVFLLVLTFCLSTRWRSHRASSIFYEIMSANTTFILLEGKPGLSSRGALFLPNNAACPTFLTMHIDYFSILKKKDPGRCPRL